MKHILFTMSLIFGATAVSAASFQGKDAFKILEDGVIIHSTEILDARQTATFTFSTTYSVIYKRQPYVCMVDRTSDGTFASCFEDERKP